MKKNELMNGDFVVMRSGLVGLVILNGQDDGYVVFDDHAGWEDLCFFDEDMVFTHDNDPIMQVYRGPRGFNELVEDIPCYERDENWFGPIDVAYHQMLVEEEKQAKTREEERAAQGSPSGNGLISIVTQAFYGNRTGTEVRKDEIDSFIRGHLDGCSSEDPTGRIVVKLPGSDKLVLIYNQISEERRMELKARAWEEDQYVMKPLATIPELDLEIYSRCIVCRMNEDGEFESLGEGDFEIWNRYLAY